jgi:ribonuclease Y
MSEYLILILGAGSLAAGATLGYLARQSIAKFQSGSIEETLQKKITETKQEAQNIILDAKKKAFSTLQESKNTIESKERSLTDIEKNLERQKGIVEQKSIDFDKKEKEFNAEKERISQIKKKAEQIISQKKLELEKISGLSKPEAKAIILREAEKENKEELERKMARLEKEGEEKFQKKSKEILAFAIQRGVSSTLEDFTTINVPLPDDEIKGRIIGKEGRNIKAFENATGVELIVDETPKVVFLSSFDPLRREIGKIALLELIKDGRIQPSRIEEIVQKIEEEMPERIQKIGEEAAHDLEVFGLDPKLYQLLGRLKFRTSFGQNVLEHSREVAFISSALAAEIGGDVKIAKKAALFHDIGKAVDWEVEGSHTEIGVRILKKFGLEDEVIKAMKSHHEEHPYETLESIIVQTADAISAARPGARKSTPEDYLKRIEELEKIAAGFEDVKDAFAIEAGRELRVFVKSEEVDDYGAKKLAKEIAKKIEEELQYPGEIRVNVIRETRVVEYAR